MDTLLNPAAPSGRKPDASFATTAKDREVLPAGTRRYVDSGGAKHFLLPDGSSRYVPPGELGNFTLEDESPRDLLRRHLFETMSLQEAYNANAALDSAFDGLDIMARAGLNLMIVPVDGAHDDLRDAINKAQANASSNPVEYPRHMYHADGRDMAVADEDAEKEAADDGFVRTQEEARDGRNRGAEEASRPATVPSPEPPADVTSFRENAGIVTPQPGAGRPPQTDAEG